METAGDDAGESVAVVAAAALEAIELESARRRVPARAGLAVHDTHAGLAATFAARKTDVAQFVVQQVRPLVAWAGAGRFSCGSGGSRGVTVGVARRQDTAMQKQRIVILGFGTARQKRVLE
jgi:hypothetical protein